MLHHLPFGKINDFVYYTADDKRLCMVLARPVKGAVGRNGIKGQYLVVGGSLDGYRFASRMDAEAALDAVTAE